MTKSDSFHCHMIERVKNFRWNIDNPENFIDQHESYFFNLDIIMENILACCNATTEKRLSKPELLDSIFRQMYRKLKISDLHYRLYYTHSPLREDVYEAYVFSTLCAFLNTSKRIKGKTLREFVYDNDPANFHDPESPNSRNPQFLESETVKLRKARNRLLSRGNAYFKRSQWAAITRDAEYEWRFYYALDDADEIVQDTFKRLGNLYADIGKALNSVKDDGYTSRVMAARAKFLSKLGKLRYQNYLMLLKTILFYIDHDTRYYGLNLYRFERRLQGYKITNEIKRLFACKSNCEEVDFLRKSAILSDITFPKIYEDFLPLPNSRMESCAYNFPGFLQKIVCSSCLILDWLVEKGILGDAWEPLFVDTINTMAKDVLYDPNSIDYTVGDNFQEKFMRLLYAPVVFMIHPKDDDPIYASEFLICDPASPPQGEDTEPS